MCVWKACLSKEEMLFYFFTMRVEEEFSDLKLHWEPRRRATPSSHNQKWEERKASIITKVLLSKESLLEDRCRTSSPGGRVDGIGREVCRGGRKGAAGGSRAAVPGEAHIQDGARC